jgi:predicted transcriptional regulator of viral defense system
MAQILALPESDRTLVLWIQRQRLASLAAVQAFLQQDKVTTLALLQRLEQQGYLEVLTSADGSPAYRVRLISMRRRQPRNFSSSQDLWDRLLD